MALQREGIAKHATMFPAISQQCPSGTFVCKVLCKGDNRIDRCDKGRTVCNTEQFCSRHHQMPTSRKAHRPNLFGIDTIVGSMSSHITQGLQQVILRIRVAYPSEQITIAGDEGWCLCCPIAQYKGCNAILLKPACHIMAFGLHIVPEITATRANDDPCIVLSFNRIGYQFHLHISRCTLPDIHLGRYADGRQ